MEAMTTSVLPDEIILRAMQMLPPLCSHAALCASSRSFRSLVLEDSLWTKRLAQDFPLACRQKPPGFMYKIYRMLAKSQRRSAELRQLRRGPAGVFGTGFDQRKDFDEEPCVNHAMFELRRLAARFAKMNTDIDSVIPVRRGVAVVAELPRHMADLTRRGNLGYLLSALH
ncbi:unnamed protein product, partial [Polarella glacialis]